VALDKLLRFLAQSTHLLLPERNSLALADREDAAKMFGEAIRRDVWQRTIADQSPQTLDNAVAVR